VRDDHIDGATHLFIGFRAGLAVELKPTTCKPPPMVTAPKPYTHYRAPGDSDVAAGVYRVVGTDEGTVRLLQVTDADGRRVNTGRVVTVDRTVLSAAFADAENPDAGFRPWQVVDGMIEEVKMVGRWVGRLLGG
jgi:hypothetical protein